MLPHRWMCYASHPLQSSDRLGGKDFPIAMAFGDRDFFGTEGADEIVKNNKNFSNGKSQLFKVQNCSHFMNFD